MDLEVATTAVGVTVAATLDWADGDELGHGDKLLGDGDDLLNDDNLDDLALTDGLEGGGAESLVQLEWDWLWSWGNSWWWNWSLLLDRWRNWSWGRSWSGLDVWLGNWLLNEDTWRSLWWLGSLDWGLWWWWWCHGAGVLWTVADWRVAGHLLAWTNEVLALDGIWDWSKAALGILTLLDVEDWAVLNAARDVGASINSLLQNTRLPSHDEVTVVTVTSWVTVREDELSVNAVESVGIPNNLEHETWEASLEAVWAGAGHDGVWVGNVSLVVWSGDVLTVPARWEHKLDTDTILAVGIKESLVWHLVTEKSALWIAVVVHAVESESAGLEAAGEGTLLGVTSDHGEALWEGSDLRVSWGIVEEVVSGRCQRTVADRRNREVLTQAYHRPGSQE